MADRSKIEWTDASWNPVRARNLVTGKVGWHCEHASPGCAGCYSEAFNARLGTGLPFKPGHRADVEVFLDPKLLLQPLRWTRPRMIFVCSMTDLFADFVTDEMIDQVFALMALCPQHTFQVLTKRPGRMREYTSSAELHDRITAAACVATELEPRLVRSGKHISVRRVSGIDKDIGPWPLPNVWLGVSVEDQRRADERVPVLLATPAAVRFVSAEPLLGPVDFRSIPVPPPEDAGHRGNALEWHEVAGAVGQCIAAIPAVDWVIVGGESGRNSRAMHPAWARSIRDQCAAAGVAFFFKQWGEWAPSTDEESFGNPSSGYRSLRAHTEGRPKREELYAEAGAAFVARVGKKAAGRLLDGVTHDDLPVSLGAVAARAVGARP